MLRVSLIVLGYHFNLTNINHQTSFAWDTTQISRIFVHFNFRQIIGTGAWCSANSHSVGRSNKR